MAGHTGLSKILLPSTNGPYVGGTTGLTGVVGVAIEQAHVPRIAGVVRARRTRPTAIPALG